MKLATWNLYWLGHPENGAKRTAADEQRVACVLAALDPDLLVLQEVCDLETLRRVLDFAAAAGGRRLTWQDPAGAPVLAPKASTDDPGRVQQVVLVHDPDRVEVTRFDTLGHQGTQPLTAHCRWRPTGTELTVVGVHLRSGWPDFHDAGSAARRKRECAHLAGWLADQGHQHDRVVVLGDFNALHTSPHPADALVVDSLAPLREGALAGWTWDDPLPDRGQVHTSITDRLTIDHVLLSPALAATVSAPPRIYAYDRHDDVAGTPAHGLPADFDWERISDHRPVACGIELS